MIDTQPFVDTHCHIDSILARDKITWPELQARMVASPAEKIIHVACHPDGLEWARDFCEQETDVYGAFGIHPHEASLYTESIEAWLRGQMGARKAVAFGEIGLDYHYDYSPRDIQKNVFGRQLRLACEQGKPVVLHTREADEDTLALLQDFDSPDLRIHVHCYTGSPEFAQRLLDLKGEFYFGFTGVLTFKNGENVRAAARVIPRDRLLLETDGPYLAPVPWRGQTAHPGMIPAIATALAACRGEDTAELMKACRENTRRFYGI